MSSEDAKVRRCSGGFCFRLFSIYSFFYQDFANQMALRYVETSAKSGDGIKEAFEHLALDCYEMLNDSE